MPIHSRHPGQCYAYNPRQMRERTTKTTSWDDEVMNRWNVINASVLCFVLAIMLLASLAAIYFK